MIPLYPHPWHFPFHFHELYSSDQARIEESGSQGGYELLFHNPNPACFASRSAIR